MEKKPSRRVPEEKAATLDEVETAIEQLTQGQWLRLLGFAEYRIDGLWHARKGRDAKDLLQEAITATLEGKRRWNKEAVDFPGHLFGVVRSISSHWAEECDNNEALLESSVTPIADNADCNGPFTRVSSEAPDPESIACARQQLVKIKILFADDDLDGNVLECMIAGFTGPETCEVLGIPYKQFEATGKRIRRTINKNGLGRSRA